MTQRSIEQLTDDERAAQWPPTGRLWAKTLRIIDAHAADRAALVAQLEASLCRTPWLEQEKRHAAQVSELTAELAEKKAIVYATNESFCVEVQLRLAAESQVAELTRERDEARVQRDEAAVSRHAFQKEVTRLTEALEAAEQRTRTELARVDAAEARARELEGINRGLGLEVTDARSECAALRDQLAAEEKAAAAMVKGARDAAEFHLRNSDAEYDRRIAAESRLAAANVLLERWESQSGGFGPVSLHRDTVTHLAAQEKKP